uniref:Major facilitator superfamily associated domain-containing protein n=1 Tax=Ascaris lumbricoides TaxID=6252 RepID=A0A0M3HJX9_ASCLU
MDKFCFSNRQMVLCNDSREGTAGCSPDNVIIVPHVQISPNESHLFNRAISSGGGMLAGWLITLFALYLNDKGNFLLCFYYLI